MNGPNEPLVGRRAVLRLVIRFGLLAGAAAACGPATPPQPTPVTPAKPAAAPATAAPAAAPAKPTDPPKPAATVAAVAAPASPSLTIVTSLPAKALDPHLARGDDNQILNNVYEPPLFADYIDFGIVNRLATDVKLDAEGHMMIKLRDGVKFHGGESFTADDVKYSIERMIDPATNSFNAAKFNADIIQRVEVVDPLTLRIVINQPPKPVLYVDLSNLWIMPRSWAQGKPKEFFAQNANGTGPYKVSSFVPEQVVELAANDSWWGGKLPFKKVTMRFNEEASARLAMGQRGEADVVASLSPDLVSTAKGAGLNVVVASTAGPGFVALSNLSPENPVDPGKPNPLRDIRVRQALNYAIDRAPIMKNLLNDLALPIQSWIPEPTMRGYVPPDQLTQFSYNPDKARQLLRDAGFANGFTNRIRLPEKQWVKGQEVALAIADQLNDIGVKTEVDPMPIQIWIDTIFSSKTAPMHLELGWPTPISPWNLPGSMTGRLKWFEDAELTQTYKDTFKLTLPEQDAALRSLTKIVWEKVPVIWLWHPTTVWAISPKIDWPKLGDIRYFDFARAKPLA